MKPWLNKNSNDWYKFIESMKSEQKTLEDALQNYRINKKLQSIIKSLESHDWDGGGERMTDADYQTWSNL